MLTRPPPALAVLTAPPVSLPPTTLKPAYLMLASCYRDLARETPTHNAELSRRATACLQRVYGVDVPCAHATSEWDVEADRKSMDVSGRVGTGLEVESEPLESRGEDLACAGPDTIPHREAEADGSTDVVMTGAKHNHSHTPAACRAACAHAEGRARVAGEEMEKVKAEARAARACFAKLGALFLQAAEGGGGEMEGGLETMSRGLEV